MISAVIPTLNEEDFVAEAIRRVRFADEILVIDSFSSDNTVEAATRAGAKVIQRRFDDFSNQKNFAIREVKHPWILFVDADERVSDDLAKEIKRTLKEPGNKVAFYLYRNFYFKGEKVSYGGWQTDKAIRLFKKGSGRFNGNLVHEIIETAGPIGFLKNRLDHYSYRSREQYERKLEMYAQLQAKELFQKNKKPRIWHLTIKPAFRFVVHYLVRLGFLDGAAGFELARAHGLGVWKRYSYLEELYEPSQNANISVKQKL